MDERVEVLIVGGGVIGTSLAWALAARGVGGVVVLDLDLAGVYASSELNAGGARATWWQPVNIETCKLTLDFFREHQQEFGFRDLGYLTGQTLPLRKALEIPEREIIERTLRSHNWNRQETAAALMINRTTLFNKMRKYDLLGTRRHEQSPI